MNVICVYLWYKKDICCEPLMDACLQTHEMKGFFFVAGKCDGLLLWSVDILCP